MSFSLIPSNLSAPEGDLVQRITDLEGVLDRKRLTIQAIATKWSDQHNQIGTWTRLKFIYHPNYKRELTQRLVNDVSACSFIQCDGK